MKKTLVKGLVALAAGALLAGGLLGCQQTVDPIDSITVKPSSLDSANVKAVQAPGFFALTWDRVKNCDGYAIEVKDVATGDIKDITQWIISSGDNKIPVAQTSADLSSMFGFSPLEGERYEYEFTVIALSNSASGRAATTVQNSYSSVHVVFEPVPDNYAKPAVPSDVEATLVYAPLSDGETTTVGRLSGSFTAKAGVKYALVQNVNEISVDEDGNLSVSPESSIDFWYDRVRGGKASFNGYVTNVTPSAEYKYTLVAYYEVLTVSGKKLYDVEELTAVATAQEAYANFAVSSDEQTAGDTVIIGAEWNKAYGGSLEYAVLTDPIAYMPEMTAAEIYALLGTKTKVDVAEDNVATDRNVASFTVNRADKGTVTYVVVILKKDDTYQMRTVTVAPKATTGTQKYRGYAMQVGTNNSKQYLAQVYIEFLDGTDITQLKPTDVSYKIGWTAYKTLNSASFDDNSFVRIPIKSDKTTTSYVKSDYNELESTSIYQYSETVLFGTNTDTMDDIECALYVDDELVTW